MKVSVLFLIALVQALIQATAVRADEETLDYLYEPTLPDAQSLEFNRMAIHARNEELGNALDLSEKIMDSITAADDQKSLTYGKLQVNHGILLSADGQYDLGLISIQKGLDTMERSINPFSTELIDGLMAKGVTLFALNQPREAEDSFRRSQHIMHRDQGVYGENQLPVISWLTKTNLKSGLAEFADREQKFALRVAEKAFGPDSIKMLPHLNNIGAYFATRGGTIPPMLHSPERLQRDLLFKSSIEMYRKAVTIIEDNYGENDPRLVHSLRGLAKARMLQMTNRRRAEAPLIRSLSIVESDPDSGITDRAQAMVDLADLYTMLTDDRAGQIYLDAWQLLQENEDTMRIANDLFGSPTRLYPRYKGLVYLDRQPDAGRGTPLIVNLEYTVNTNGKVGPIRVLEKNVPNEQVRLLRYRMKTSKYRPRIHDGEIVKTEGLNFIQQYSVLPSDRPEPTYARLRQDNEDSDPDSVMDNDNVIDIDSDTDSNTDNAEESAIDTPVEEESAEG